MSPKGSHARAAPGMAAAPKLASQTQLFASPRRGEGTLKELAAYDLILVTPRRARTAWRASR